MLQLSRSHVSQKGEIKKLKCFQLLTTPIENWENPGNIDGIAPNRPTPTQRTNIKSTQHGI